MQCKCSVCSREQEVKPTKKGEARLPPGWKRHVEDSIYCRDCWSKSFVLRAVTIPVATVIEGGEWFQFLDACAAGWRSATHVANWAVFEIARNETTRTADMERMPPYPKMYLYPGARKVAPDLDPSSTVALLHAVEGKYRKERLATIWHRKKQLPIYKYPIPIPLHNQAWEAIAENGDRPCISMRFGGQRWTIALQTHNSKRQLGKWRQICERKAVKGELAIIGQEVTKSDHKQNGERREANGGRRKTIRVMAKMVAWFPREARAEKGGETLYLRTDGESFLIYHVGLKGEVKHIKAEHIKRWEAKHARHLRAMAHDLKFEKRWPSHIRRQSGERQDLWVKKHKDKIDSFMNECTSIIANFALRQRVSTVIYDDSNKAFVDRFPWSKLKNMLGYKLDEKGIELQASPDEEPGEDEEPEA